MQVSDCGYQSTDSCSEGPEAGINAREAGRTPAAEEAGKGGTIPREEREKGHWQPRIWTSLTGLSVLERQQAPSRSPPMHPLSCLEYSISLSPFPLHMALASMPLSHSGLAWPPQEKYIPHHTLSSLRLCPPRPRHKFQQVWAFAALP